MVAADDQQAAEIALVGVGRPGRETGVQAGGLQQRRVGIDRLVDRCGCVERVEKNGAAPAPGLAGVEAALAADKGDRGVGARAAAKGHAGVGVEAGGYVDGQHGPAGVVDVVDQPGVVIAHRPVEAGAEQSVDDNVAA